MQKNATHYYFFRKIFQNYYFTNKRVVYNWRRQRLLCGLNVYELHGVQCMCISLEIKPSATISCHLREIKYHPSHIRYGYTLVNH